MSQRFGWGHINVNVRDLDVSVDFYRKLGFEVFIPGIPYLGLSAEQPLEVVADAAEALGIPPGTAGRACIMQLDNGFPKLDLTEFSGWSDPERIAVNVDSLYREFSGADEATDVLELFARMADLAGFRPKGEST